ncbi:hypothetical protein H4R33_000094 [Dimargaris cristalligena]|uniref:Uncharacterized protein n=1 Tax=Dimargaris cristalligena TaxID=215637 RepID=A0A4P9ZSP8_9FUNG|nr:hypothetical protein H4R33_000094 [Dimargaris cristalligena]RKP36218.1 hypothetical protein BJ085DRAFT_39614 [Dimargaris cristalligena]|eukprot:RKP36218.1 hypothetical protein BJ085DRAFT_39614 [Dimargaris cristalligena]
MDHFKNLTQKSTLNRGRNVVLGMLLFFSVAALVVGILGLIFRPKKKYLYYVGFGFGFWIILGASFYYQYRKRGPLNQGLPQPAVGAPPNMYQPAYDAYGRPMVYTQPQPTYRG